MKVTIEIGRAGTAKLSARAKIQEASKGFSPGQWVYCKAEQLLPRAGVKFTLTPESFNPCVEIFDSLGGDSQPLPVDDVSKGCVIRELNCGDQLVYELGFQHFEIEPLDEEAASTVIMNNLAQGSAKSQVLSLLHQLPSELWNRPLMATLLGQYLASVGIETARSLTTSVAEMTVFRFIVAQMIRGAAKAVGQPALLMQRDLAALCLRKQTAEDRIIRCSKELGQDLWEDARRGHIQLFEPVEGGTAVQFYHLRLSEVLAAQAWEAEGVTLPQACVLAAAKKGLAVPLRFVLQQVLARQKKQEDLSISFADYAKKVDNEVLINLAQAIPPALRSIHLDLNQCTKIICLGLVKVILALPSMMRIQLEVEGFSQLTNKTAESLSFQMKAFPLADLFLNFSGCKQIDGEGLALLAQGLIGCGKTLRRLGLEFRSCGGINDNGLISLGDALPPRLQMLSLILGSCKKVTDAGIKGICRGSSPQDSDTAVKGDVKGLAGAPNLDTFKLKIMDSNKIHDASLIALGAHLPERVRSLELRFSNCPQLTDAGLEQFGEELQEHPSLQATLQRIELFFDGCHWLTDKGAEALLQKLPERISELSLNLARCAHSSYILSGRTLTTLGAQLRDRLKFIRKLNVNFEKNFSLVKDEHLAAFGASLPENLQSLEIDLGFCSKIGDKGLSGLVSKLPAVLRMLHLEFENCVLIGDEGISALAVKLPAELEILNLSFLGCEKVGSKGLQELGAHLPVGLKELKLNVYRCKKLGDLALEKLCALLPPTLSTLDLRFGGCFKIGGSGIRALANRLPDHLRLLSLNFRECKAITDIDLKVLSEAIESRRSMELTLEQVSIDFGGCLQVTSSGIQILCRGLLAVMPARKGSQLEYSYLSRNVRVQRLHRDDAKLAEGSQENAGIGTPSV